jgi:hypothetical protein
MLNQLLRQLGRLMAAASDVTLTTTKVLYPSTLFKRKKWEKE